MELRSEGSGETKARCVCCKKLSRKRCRDFLINHLHFSEIKQSKDRMLATNKDGQIYTCRKSDLLQVLYSACNIEFIFNRELSQALLHQGAKRTLILIM